MLNECDRPLKAGDVIRLGDKTIWFVDSVTGSGAHIFELTGHEAKITTGKKWRDPETGVVGRKTKVVKRHGGYRVISATALVEQIDPSKLDQLVLRKRVKMARKEGQVEGNGSANQGSEAPATQETVRATQSYVRTNKAPKEGMRGQGKIVLDAIDKAQGPVNVASLAKTIGKFEGSRQDAERVIGFYLSKFKREGLINVAQAAPAAEAPAEAAAAAE